MILSYRLWRKKIELPDIFGLYESEAGDGQRIVGSMSDRFSRPLALLSPRVETSVRERRKYERFSLKLPTRIDLKTPGHEQGTLECMTSDISAGGAFFCTDKKISEGTRVKLDIVVSTDWLKNLTGAQAHLEVAGTVVRSAPRGVAISFDGEHRFLRRMMK